MKRSSIAVRLHAVVYARHVEDSEIIEGVKLSTLSRVDWLMRCPGAVKCYGEAGKAPVCEFY